MRKISSLIPVGMWLAAAASAAHVAYTYDAAGRLAKADYGNGVVFSYTYDKAGNLLSRTVTASAPTPVIFNGGVISAASYQGGAVAPGEIVAIYGSSLGPVTLAGLQASNGLVSNNVAGTQFFFDGIAAPIIYVSGGQSAAIVPFEVAGKSSTQLQAAYQGVKSAPVTIPVVPALPGIFTLNLSGTGQGAIVNQDGTVNGASNRAAKGSYVSIYMTGDGQTNPPEIDGQIANGPIPTAASVSVSIGGANAPVLYSGVAGASVAGFTQINVTVPANAPSGTAVPLVVTIGGIQSQPGVTIAIQ
jgi:uncharacterized protein (TIGR03437 family)